MIRKEISRLQTLFSRFRPIAFLTLASLYLFNSNSTIWACTDPPPLERYCVSYFDPEILGDTTFRACYIDASLFSNEDFAYNMPPEELYRANLLEWQQYCNGKPALGDIANVIYELDAEKLDERALQPLQSGQNVLLPLSRNSFVRHLAQKKDLNAFQYILFSKECEQHVNSGGDWDYDGGRDTVMMQTLIERGKQLAAQTSSVFLRLRYGFQIVRLAHYSRRYTQAITLYDEWVKPIANNSDPTAASGNLGLAYHWATALKAGALLHKGKNAESLYWFSKVFANTADRRDVMLHNFGNPSEDTWRKALSMAAKPQEKAVLWLMRGAADNENLDFEALKNMYAIAPQYTGTDVLLVREVNKVERLLLSPYLTQSLIPPPQFEEGEGEEEYQEGEGEEEVEDESTGYRLFNLPYRYGQAQTKLQQASLLETIGDFFRGIWRFFRRLFGYSDDVGESDETKIIFSGEYPQEFQNKAYVKQLRDFVGNAAQEGKVRNAAVWQVSAAYLSYLADDYSAATKWLDLVKTSEKSIVQQAAIVRGLNEIEIQKSVTPQAEESLHKGLAGRKISDDEYNNYSVPNRVLSGVAQRYIQQGEVGKAALCLAKANENIALNILLDCYATNEDLEKMFGYVSEKPQTPFDAFLFKNSILTRDVILDIQGTKLLREAKYAEALKKFEQILPAYWPRNNTASTEDNYNVFSSEYGNFYTDFNEITGEETGGYYNKLTFTRQVVELLQRAESNPAKSDKYYYRLGNGFVFSPFWGYNDRLWRGNLVYTLGYGENLNYPLNIPSIADSLLKAQQRFKAEYGTRDRAKFFYEKVYTTSKDRELAAEAIYMAKLCENEPFASFHEGDTQNPTLPKLLASKYSDTKFYEQIIVECADLKLFLE